MNEIFRPLPQAFIRIPTLPVESLGQATDPDVANDNPLLREAIYIASASLMESLAHRQHIPKRKQRQVNSSLFSYVNRMSSRTTPFGFFAGVAQVSIGEHTRIELGKSSDHRHRTRLDMEWLLNYVSLLEKDPRIEPMLKYTYQQTCLRIGNRYRFEHWDDQGALTNTSIAITAGVEVLLQKTTNGIRHDNLLHEMLVEFPEAAQEEMANFIDRMRRYGIISSSLRPPLTCRNPAQYVATQLSEIPAAQPIVHALKVLLEHLAAYDHMLPGTGEAALRRLTREATKIHPFKATRVPFDIDLALQFKDKPCIQHTIATDAALFADLLLRLSAPRTDAAQLNDYQKSFVEKYGYHRLVPVLEVLNLDVGIGLPGHRHQRNRQNSSAAAIERQELQLSLALEALRQKQTVINLTDKHLAQLTERLEETRIPQSLDIAVQIAATSQKDLNDGNYLVALSPLAGSPMAGRIAGRFADMLGQDTINYLKEVATIQEAQDPHRLYAELVYTPHSGHAANVAICPPLRGYEIVIGATPSVSGTRRLALSDLAVGADHERLFVWSTTHQREVVVRAGHMLNPKKAPNVCRLLTGISYGNEARLTAFSWHGCGNLPMVPRIQYGRFVLAPATWLLSSKEVLNGTPRTERTMPHGWRQYIKHWREKWRVPRFVYLREGDRRLLLDLEHEKHIEALFYETTAHGRLNTLRLDEALPGPDDAWINSSDGHHLHECIFQLVRTSQGATEKRTVRSAPVDHTSRMHLPGSEWLFCKLYFPSEQQNEYLSSYIASLVAQLTNQHMVDSWFFIRYSDPRPHIRVRFKTTKSVLMRSLLPLVFAWAQQMHQQGLLQTFVIDAYEREIERYGGSAAIESAEAIFAAESRASIRMLTLHSEGGLGMHELIDIAVLFASIVLSQLSLDDTAITAWAKSRAKESAQFSRSYRDDRHRILLLIQGYRESRLPETMQHICHTLAKECAEPSDTYRKLELAGVLTPQLEQIAASLLHMLCNRLLGTDRSQERRMLTYLWRIFSDLPKWQSGTNRAVPGQLTGEISLGDPKQLTQ